MSQLDKSFFFFSINRRFAIIWPTSPYKCKFYIRDYAHLHCVHKIDTDHLSLFDFPFIAYTSLFADLRKYVRVRVYLCRIFFPSHNLLQYIYADLFNRCSLLVQLHCELFKMLTTYGPYTCVLYIVRKSPNILNSWFNTGLFHFLFNCEKAQCVLNSLCSLLIVSILAVHTQNHHLHWDYIEY